MADARKALLLAGLDEAFDGPSWHGPSLRGAVRGLSARQAARRPARGRHNIWELTVHAAYWKYAAWRRLTRGERGSFALKGSNFFPCPSPLTETAWKEAVALLVREHRRLRKAVEALRAPNIRVVRGVAAHDLYHAGQIQLLKRLVR